VTRPWLNPCVEPVRLYAPRGRLLLYAAGSLVFVAAGGWLITSFGPLGRVVGVAAILFFGLCAAYYARELLWRRPTLQIDADGIVDRSTVFPAGRVAWRDIRGVRIVAAGRQRLLGIDVRDPAALARSASRLGRVILRTNTRMGYPEVAIPRYAVPRPLESVIEDMRRFHPALAVRADD